MACVLPQLFKYISGIGRGVFRLYNGGGGVIRIAVYIHCKYFLEGQSLMIGVHFTFTVNYGNFR